MSAARLPGELEVCGCCGGVDVSTPVAIDNRPGLTAIAYRVGTHATFKQTLLARLSSAEHRMLGALRTREDEDFTIALLDAWSVACDVLAFYQERIANESYLRTATERRSLLELSKLIGYELKPGVAASTWLAFTLEDPPGAPDQATARTVVEAGTRVQSIPGPDEKPQVYESIEEIEARVAWNAIRPRLTRRQPIVADTSKPLYFAGLATGLKAGDGLFLFPDQGTPLFRQVASITLQAAQQRTEVRLEPLSRLEFPIHGIAQGSSLDLVSTKLGVVGGVTSSLMAKGSWASSDLHATAIAGQFVEQHVFQNLFAARPSPPGVLVFRARAAAFGHNAPLWASLPATQRVGEVVQTSTDPAEAEYHAGVFSDRKDSWADTATLDSYADLVGHANCVFLDNTYPAIAKGSRVVLREGKTAVLYTVSDAVEVSQADFGLSAKVTRLRLNSNTSLDSFGIRGTSIYGASEELPLAPVPVEEPVAGTTIELEGWVEGLSVGQSIVVCGELHTMSGVRACEYATLQSVTHDLTPDGCTEVTLAGLTNSYVRDTVTIFGNVARATHGESVKEVLGSGAATQAFQKFKLKQPPLTYVKAANARGAQSTLAIRVNDLLWHESPTLAGCGPRERTFASRLDDDGDTEVQFGDGVMGARLPTGAQNARAEYRKGIGLEGLVRAGQLSMLLTRPLGVKGVTNPLSAEGAADPEVLADARRNAPLTVLTLDRIVSMRDYEDFARGFGGIAKAMATWASQDGVHTILVTVAGPGGAAVPAGSATRDNLAEAMRLAGDPFVPVRIESYRPALFRIGASVKVHGDFERDKVLGKVQTALRERFGFEARSFGQPVVLSEVVAVMQAVAGVVAVDLDRLQRVGAAGGQLQARLTAEVPRGGAFHEAAAELLTLDPGPLELGVMQ